MFSTNNTFGGIYTLRESEAGSRLWKSGRNSQKELWGKNYIIFNSEVFPMWGLSAISLLESTARL